MERLVKIASILSGVGVKAGMKLIGASIVQPIATVIAVLVACLRRYVDKRSATDLVKCFFFDPDASALGTIISKSFRHR
jgi:hypothetical protein